MTIKSGSTSLTAVVYGMLAAIVFAAWALLRDDGEDASVTDKLSDGFWDFLNGIVKGRRVTNAPYSKRTGVVPGSPDSLASNAGVDVEVYSLARALASEEGVSPIATQAAVAHAINNHANQSGKSITALVIAAVNPAHRGSYGTQKDIFKDLAPDGVTIRNAAFGKSDRYCSTANDPYQGHIDVAQGVLDGTIPDITDGADQFDRPSGEANPLQVAINRVNSGSEQVDVEGVDDGDIRFWRKL